MKMTKSRLAFAFWLVVWSWFGWFGFGLYAGVVAQHVAGYPNGGQFVFCFVVPGCLIAAHGLLIAFARNLDFILKLAILVLEPFAAFWYLALSLGGV